MIAQLLLENYNAQESEEFKMSFSHWLMNQNAYSDKPIEYTHVRDENKEVFVFNDASVIKFTMIKEGKEELNFASGESSNSNVYKIEVI